jgi:serine/threonine protein kinase
MSDSVADVVRDLHILVIVARGFATFPGERMSRRGTRGIRTSAPQMPADRWGRFTLASCLASGSFGTVYRTHDSRRGLDVALKVPRVGRPNREHNARLLEEAQRLGRVRHPGVVRLYGTGTHGRRTGFWMELVDGRTVDEIQQECRRLALTDVLRVGRELAVALDAVHAAGVVHGDVKPQNVMIERGTERVVLIDFGCARTSGARTQSRLSGTPLYLAPELLAGDAPSPASDVYSLGVLLFHLISGEFPITADDLPALAVAHRTGRLRRLEDLCPDVPPAVSRAVDRCLRLRPDARPHTAGAFGRDLVA